MVHGVFIKTEVMMPLVLFSERVGVTSFTGLALSRANGNLKNPSNGPESVSSYAHPIIPFTLVSFTCLLAPRNMPVPRGQPKALQAK